MDWTAIVSLLLTIFYYHFYMKKVLLLTFMLFLFGCSLESNEKNLIDFMAMEECINQHFSELPIIQACDQKQRRINAGFRWEQDLVETLENIEKKGDDYFKEQIQKPAQKKLDENCLRWVEQYSEDLIKRADDIDC